MTLIKLRLWKKAQRQCVKRARRWGSRKIRSLPRRIARALITTIGRILPEPDAPARETNWATDRERIYGYGVDYWRDKLTELGLKDNYRKVLEIGSGNGQWLVAFGDRADMAIGIEPWNEIRNFSAEMIRQNLKNGTTIHLVAAKAESVPIKNESVDLVFCAGVLMFTRQTTAMSEMTRVVTPGGTLCITANGLGYFIMNFINGLRYKDENKLTYAIKGILFTMLKWGMGRHGFSPTAVRPGEIKRALEKEGCYLQRSKAWLAHNLYPYHYLGFTTNYAFLAKKKYNFENVALRRSCAVE